MSSNVIKDLVKQAKNGDTAAFGKLYTTVAADLYRFAVFQTGSPTRAEDAVSEAVLRAFQKIRNLEKAQAFRSWMFSILLNCCREQLREKQAQLRTVSPEDANAPQDAVDLSENAALKQAMAQLEAEERELFLLSVLFGYTSKELAEMTNSKPGTVRSRLFRTKEKLQALLKE